MANLNPSLQICSMIEIARDIFDVDHIITSLRGDVRILKKLSPSLLLVDLISLTILS
ncbi:hypothetical protein HanIR_Chr02g0067031 [Helianthus annuus]|nr:hypothetical protein HanIR_Chr02g0067031 [Helianthus annuus]